MKRKTVEKIHKTVNLMNGDIQILRAALEESIGEIERLGGSATNAKQALARCDRRKAYRKLPLGDESETD